MFVHTNPEAVATRAAMNETAKIFILVTRSSNYFFKEKEVDSMFVLDMIEMPTKSILFIT